MININKIHALKILTLTLSLGGLQSIYAAEIPRTTPSPSLSIEVENKNTTTILQTTFEEKKAEIEKQLTETEEKQKKLLIEIEQLRSTFSPMESAINAALIAGSGIALLEFMNTPLLPSVFFPVTAATYYYLTYLQTFIDKINKINLEASFLNAEMGLLNLKSACLSMTQNAHNISG